MKSVMHKNTKEKRQYEMNCLPTPVCIFQILSISQKLSVYLSGEGTCLEFYSLCGDLTSEMEVGSWAWSLRKREAEMDTEGTVHSQGGRISGQTC